MSPTIRIDSEVYVKLQEQAEPFVDTPNTVLRRLLGLTTELQDDVPEEVAKPQTAAEAANPPALRKPTAERTKPSRRTTKRSGPKRTRVPSGSLLPEPRYQLPLLQALLEFGGAAPYRQVMDRVGELLKADMTDLDLARLESGAIRWENRLQFVRLRLIKEGLMLKESGRGIWAISDQGKQYFDRHEGAGVGDHDNE